MTIDEYRRLSALIHSARVSGRRILADADGLESLVLRMAGVTHVDREPGKPGWCIEGLSGWFNSPEAAIAARAASADAGSP